MVSENSAGGRDGVPAQTRLGLLLRRLRRERGLSQRDLLRPLSLGSHSVIVDWEAGRRIPPADVLRAYERHFGLRPGELLALRERAQAEREDPAEPAVPAGCSPEPARAGITAAVVPRQLPGNGVHFVGRDGALAELDRVLDTGAGPATVVITAISGMAGIGKTALAVHAAHRLAARFPDGQLYVNLRGFGPSGQPLAPGAAIRGFLDALEIPAARIPADPDAQAGLYRSLLAGQRMLVVADNARDAGQVRPLLPGAAGCAVLVTSRNQLTSLITADGAHLIDLDVFTAAEALDLLAARLGSDRVAAEPQAATDIISRCGRLPLALAVVAARAAARPGYPLSSLSAELCAACGPLDALSGAGDLAADLRAVFSWSYRALSPAAARLFRLLGLHPGPDCSAPAAASLVSLPLTQTRLLLAELAAAHLTGEPAPGRYACHDLLRAYAAELAQVHDPDPERHAAVRRVLDHYLHTAHAAAGLLTPDPPVGHVAPPSLCPGTTPERLAGYAAAWAWFEAEYQVLLAGIRQAAATGLDTHAWQLPWAFRGYLERRGRWPDWAATQLTALDAATKLTDREAQARAHSDIGGAYARLGDPDRADGHLRQALALFRELGQASEGYVHMQYGTMFDCQGRPGDALRHARKALALYRAAGHRRGQADALSGTGWLHAVLGDYRQARVGCAEAIALYRELGNRRGEAYTLDSLGYASEHLGEFRHAAACYEQALALLRDQDDRYFEALVLGHLGDTRSAAGDPAAASDAWRHALGILDNLGHPGTEQLRAKLAASGGGPR